MIALGRSFNQCCDRRKSWHVADSVSFTCHISGWIYVPIGWASIDGRHLARCVLFREKDQSSNKFLTWIWGATRGSHSFLSLAGWSKADRPVTSLHSWIGVVALRVVLKQMVPDVETGWWDSSGSINLRMKGEYKVPASPGKKGKKWRPILPSEKKNRPILSLIQRLLTSISSWWWVQVEKPAENPLSSRLHLLLNDGCRALLLQRC